jgi:hypothetical protein
VSITTIETDWNIDPLREVMIGVEHGLRQVVNRTKRVEWFDGNFMLDHAEWLLGVAFVAAQTYIESAIGDVWRHLHGERHAEGAAWTDFRKNCLACDVQLKPAGVTRMELINAVANYYKHHEGAKALRPETVVTLSECGLNPDDVYAYPCAHAAWLLCGSEWHLQSLCGLMKAWRSRIVTEVGGVRATDLPGEFGGHGK